MKKTTNIVSIVVFVISAFFALYYGYLSDKTMTLVFLAILVGVGIVRIVLLARDYKQEKTKYIPIRNVHIDDTKFIENGNDVIKDKDSLLIHIDDVRDDETIIKIFKDYQNKEDSTQNVNK